MACLNTEQIDYIRSDLKRRKISRSFFFEEWVDHVCCDVESLMNRGTNFKEAFKMVAGPESDTEVISAHKNVQQFLNNGYVGIKKLLLVAFLVFAASWVINLQTTGNWIGLASFLLLGLVHLRISIDFFKKRFVHKINILLSVFSFLGSLGTVTGIIMIFLNRDYGISTRGHGVDLTVFAWFFFSLLCLIYYGREYRTAPEKSNRKKTGWFLSLAAFNVLLAAISIASFPLYHYVQGYLFYLIGIILGFNSVAIALMLLSRSMKHTLALTLVIGSFMIVFIHSPFRSKLPGGKPKIHQITLYYSLAQEGIAGKLYISMFYNKFPDKPITLPLNKTGENRYEISMPSYSYRGYLYYTVKKDSVEAGKYFLTAKRPDSVKLNIPKLTEYQLTQNFPE